MCESILDKAHRHPWRTVTVLLSLNYAFWLIMMCMLDIVPMDINTVSYGSTLLAYKGYFGGYLLFQFAVFLFQYYVLPDSKELPNWVKYYYHIYGVVNLSLQFLIFGGMFGDVIAIKTATPDNVVTNFGYNYTLIEFYSRDLRFVSLNETEESTPQHPGIRNNYAYNNLINRKIDIDEFQKKHQCCGYNHPTEWIEKYSGKLTPEQRMEGSSYVWWMDNNGPSQVPASCCVKGAGPTCGIAKEGCLPVVLKEAKMNITFMTVIVLILAVCGIVRDIVLVKQLRTVDLEPFPRIQDNPEDGRLPAGSDLSLLSNIISVRIGQSSESSA